MLIKKRLVIALILIIVLIIIAWPSYFIVSKMIASSREPTTEQVEISVIPSPEPIPVSETPTEPVVLEPMTIAIYGSDARSTETSRSDVIMLIQYNPDDNSIDMVSIPRDARVEIPDRGMDKINHAYAFGGAELLTQTIENLFETEIDCYFIFKFDSFSTIIDELGGVEVNAEKDYKSDSGVLYIPQGQTILNGSQALYYVRFRSDDEGDYGRIRRQQEVIQSLYLKLFESESSNLEQTIIEIYTNNLETNIKLDKLLEYDQLIDSPTKVTFRKYMLENSGKMIDKIWYGIIDEDSLAEIKDLLSQS